VYSRVTYTYMYVFKTKLMSRGGNFRDRRIRSSSLLDALRMRPCSVRFEFTGESIKRLLFRVFSRSLHLRLFVQMSHWHASQLHNVEWPRLVRKQLSFLIVYCYNYIVSAHFSFSIYFSSFLLSTLVTLRIVDKEICMHKCAKKSGDA
jgi:hypothetical protein